MNSLIKHLNEMKNNTIKNYVLAGLDSSLIGGEHSGSVRLFEKDLNQLDNVTPHSHRFHFSCLVLCGVVENIIWTVSNEKSNDAFEKRKITYAGEPGEYTITKKVEIKRYKPDSTLYGAGEVYSMTAREIHSINFSKGAKVLFFEGPQISNNSFILEPVRRDGSVVRTFQKQPYMFIKE